MRFPANYLSCTINVNPNFKSTFSDMHLLAGSAAIDVGKTVSITDDLDEYTRMAQPDLGAYEFH